VQWSQQLKALKPEEAGVPPASVFLDLTGTQCRTEDRAGLKTIYAPYPANVALQSNLTVGYLK
jgi:hypothetical protein